MTIRGTDERLTLIYGLIFSMCICFLQIFKFIFPRSEPHVDLKIFRLNKPPVMA
jgi:hypothetical protein